MAKKKSPWHGKGKNRWRRVAIKSAPRNTYDVGLDQSLRASQRGLQDLIKDIAPYSPGSKTPAGTDSLRALMDVNLARTENARQKSMLDQDYGLGVTAAKRDLGRTLADIDYQRDTLNRNYQQLGNAQRQNFQAAGLDQGGAAAQAAQKRAANLEFEARPLGVATTRANEDYKSSLDDLLRQQQRGARDLNNQLGTANLTYGRGVEDRTTQLTRARREANRYRQDIQQTKMQQYLQGGGKRKIRVGVKQYRKLRKQGVLV